MHFFKDYFCKKPKELSDLIRSLFLSFRVASEKYLLFPKNWTKIGLKIHLYLYGILEAIFEPADNPNVL